MKKEHHQALRELIERRRAKVGIIGQGYVGLPLATAFASEGFIVTGFEVDASKVRALNKGDSYIPDVPSAQLRQVVKSGRMSATTDFSRLASMNAIIICVPTPLRKSKDPDVSYIVSAVSQVKKYLKPGQLIILESTTYPGTTRELVLPELKGKGNVVGRDFFLAFSPERVDPGNRSFGVRNTPKIVGGTTRACADLSGLLYAAIVNKVIRVSSTECAEMVKLLENTFRAVNIGLVNEVALMCDKLKLDTWEVIDAAATKPFGFMPFYPGPGIGGHCIPLDPHYLSWKLKTLNFYARFIELAGEVNSHMPDHVVTKVGDALNARGKSIKGSRILVLGVAYKKDVGDMRESPALDVMTLLKDKKAILTYHDPHVPGFSLGGHRHKSVPLSAAMLRRQDCIVITTNHSSFDIKKIVRLARLVVDSRNATKGIASNRVVKL